MHVIVSQGGKKSLKDGRDYGALCKFCAEPYDHVFWL